jgi:hypothetical protein
MSTSQHTPGDWKFTDRYIVASDPTGKHLDIYIAELAIDDDDDRVAPDEHIEPNGTLPAAAPKLLKALEDTFTILDRISDALHYEGGEPVTALEARDIEIIYNDSISELARFENLIREVTEL